MVNFFVPLCVPSSSLHLEVMPIWWCLTDWGEGGGRCPFNDLLLLNKMPRLTYDVMEDWRHFWPWPGSCYLAACLLQKKFILSFHFRHARDTVFGVGCKGGPPPKRWDAIKNRWVGDSHPFPIFPILHALQPRYFSSFFQILLTSGLFIRGSSSYFSASFHIIQPNQSDCSCRAVQKIATAGQRWNLAKFNKLHWLKLLLQVLLYV